MENLEWCTTNGAPLEKRDAPYTRQIAKARRTLATNMFLEHVAALGLLEHDLGLCSNFVCFNRSPHRIVQILTFWAGLLCP